MKKMILVLLCGLIIGGATAAIGAHAAAPIHVRVTLPSFPVQVNGITINNHYARYPLLVYKGITYFPMTWNYSQALGLSIQWSEKEGLRIDLTGGKTTLKQDLKKSRNVSNSSLTAIIPTYPIHVNGKPIDNKKEPYPILNFKNITYFPMTWRFTHDEFHWETSWSAQSGFSIVTAQVKILDEIIFDDQETLYVRTTFSDILKISKSLKDKPIQLTAAEKARISQLALEKAEQTSTPLPGYTIDYQYTKRVGDSVYYNGVELVSLKPYIVEETEYDNSSPPGYEVPRAYHMERYIPLGPDKSVISLVIYYRNDIPGPYTPHAYYNFIIHNGKAERIEDSDQCWDRIVETNDGSYWLMSFTPDDLSARNFTDRGELVLVEAGGAAHVINKHLQVSNISVISQNGNSLLVMAADRAALSGYTLPSGINTQPFGIYQVNTNGTVVKVSDLYGQAYTDLSGKTYVIDPVRNRITEIVTNRSQSWFDYELNQLLD